MQLQTESPHGTQTHTHTRMRAHCSANHNTARYVLLYFMHACMLNIETAFGSISYHSPFVSCWLSPPLSWLTLVWLAGEQTSKTVTVRPDVCTAFNVRPYMQLCMAICACARDTHSQTHHCTQEDTYTNTTAPLHGGNNTSIGKVIAVAPPTAVTCFLPSYLHKAS